MKNLFYLFAIVGLLVFVGCAANSNSGYGADKFLGKWKELDKSNLDTLLITKGSGGDTYIFEIKNSHRRKSKWDYFEGLKYNAEKDMLYRNKGIILEIAYNEESATIQAFVNHKPVATFKKITE